MMNNLDIFPDISEKLWNLKKIISKSTKEVPTPCTWKKKNFFLNCFLKQSTSTLKWQHGSNVVLCCDLYSLQAEVATLFNKFQYFVFKTSVQDLKPDFKFQNRRPGWKTQTTWNLNPSLRANFCRTDIFQANLIC